jgi:hypothetical protein
MGSLPREGKMVAVFASETMVQSVLDGIGVNIAAVNVSISVVISV